jgi:hypothetical protein
MYYRMAADAVLMLHLAFILFVVLGALLAARWPKLVALHLPVVAWGFAIEATGGECPLTFAENFLRIRAGQSGYVGGFLEQYFLYLIYPEGLTRKVQFGLAAAVIVINAAIYGWLVLGRGMGRSGKH